MHTPQRTLLVVDDQHPVRVSLAYLLGSTGYRVLSAESGPAAIMVGEKEQIDGALVDVHMPMMNGFDTCLRLQAQAHSLGRDIRVWFMTGAPTTAIERRCAEVGGLGVLSKPFDFSELCVRLENGLSSLPQVLEPTEASDASKGENDTAA